MNTTASRMRTFGLLAVVAATPLVAFGCGSSDTASTASTPTATAKAASGGPCPTVDGAVAQQATFTNTTGREVTLASARWCNVGDLPTPLFSGDANPILFDGLKVPGDGTPVKVTLEGASGLKGPVDLSYAVEGTSQAWSIMIRFGGTDNSGSVTGWDEGYEKYVSGEGVDSFRTSDGYLGQVNVIDSTITFAPRAKR